MAGSSPAMTAEGMMMIHLFCYGHLPSPAFPRPFRPDHPRALATLGIDAFHPYPAAIQPQGMAALAPQVEAVDDPLGRGAGPPHRYGADDHVGDAAIVGQGGRMCQSALNIDPLTASNFDPPFFVVTEVVPVVHRRDPRCFV